MSAVPEDFMRGPPRTPQWSRPELRIVPTRRESEEPAEHKAWAWLAVGVLFFCWIAEASLCALRGF